MVRKIAKLLSLTTAVAALAPLALFGCLLSLRRKPVSQRPAQRRATIVAPFGPGEQSGGARAIQELCQSLGGRGVVLAVISLRDRMRATGSLRTVIAGWLSRALPLPPSCRTLLLGDPELLARLADDDAVVFEFFASALVLFLRPPLPTRSVLRDHEVLVRKLALEYRSAAGLDAAILGMRMCACYLVSLSVLLKVDRIVTLTEEDERSLRRFFPWLSSRVVTVPVSFSMPVLADRPVVQGSSRDLVMVANYFHTPNVDALLWFVNECAPHLDPGFTLHLYGIDGPLDRLSLPSGPLRIVRHGFVEDLGRALPHSAIAISPVISGGGVRMKNLLLASMAHPVVTTPLGNEGIGFADGVHAVVAADAREMARRINVLADSADEMAEMGNRGRAFVSSTFGPERSVERLMAEIFVPITQPPGA